MFVAQNTGAGNKKRAPKGFGEGLFALLRTPPEGGRPVLCLQNVTVSPMHVTIGAGHLPGLDGSCRDLLTNEEYSTERGVAEVVLNPYGTCWLTT